MAEARVHRDVESLVPALAVIANRAVSLDAEEFGKRDVAEAVRALVAARGARESHDALVLLGALSLAWVNRLKTEVEDPA